MAMHPEVQERAKLELDDVVGPDRLPNFDDFNSLPYIQAILLESVRWIPVTPLGLPHATTEEDIYKGYRIPKGTVVFAVRTYQSSAFYLSSLMHHGCDH